MTVQAVYLKWQPFGPCCPLSSSFTQILEPRYGEHVGNFTPLDEAENTQLLDTCSNSGAHVLSAPHPSTLTTWPRPSVFYYYDVLFISISSFYLHVCLSTCVSAYLSVSPSTSRSFHIFPLASVLGVLVKLSPAAVYSRDIHY